MKLLIEDGITGLQCAVCEAPSQFRFTCQQTWDSEILCSVCGLTKLFEGLVGCVGITNFIQTYLKARDALNRQPSSVKQ